MTDPTSGGAGYPPPPLPPATPPAAPATPGPPGPGPAPALTGTWQRLHPASPAVRLGPGLVAVALVVIGQGVGSKDRTGDLIRLGVIVVLLLVGVVTWIVTRWRVADGAVQIETGLLRRSSLRFPLSQIQAIDIVRPGLARIFGLAELRLRMASGSRSTGRLAYMRSADAEAVRVHLSRLHDQALVQPAPPAAPGSAAPPPAAGPPPVPLYTVDTGRLVGSILLSGPAIVLWVFVAVLVVLAVASPSAAGGALAASVSSLVAIGAASWGRFNGLYRLGIAPAPDGLHLSSGLIQTTSETIPWGRIQALRTVQPLVWRLFGWYRVEADVAGRNVSGRQDRGARRVGRAIIPVGTRQEADWLVALVMPGTPTHISKPPARAAWKTPLRYRNLGFAGNDTFLVTTSGRLRRVTDRVPLAKVQSVRWTEGPLQRRLRLASIHLDTAGRSVFAVARDREAAEAGRLLAWLPDACRAARARAGATTAAPPAGERDGPW